MTGKCNVLFLKYQNLVYIKQRNNSKKITKIKVVGISIFLNFKLKYREKKEIIYEKRDKKDKIKKKLKMKKNQDFFLIKKSHLYIRFYLLYSFILYLSTVFFQKNH